MQGGVKPAVSRQSGLLMNLPWTPKTLHGALVAATAPAASCTIPLLPIGGCRWSPAHAPPHPQLQESLGSLSLAFSVFSRERVLGCGGLALPPSTGRRSHQRQLKRVTSVILALENWDHVFTSSTCPTCPDPAQCPVHSESQERFR